MALLPHVLRLAKGCCDSNEFPWTFSLPPWAPPRRRALRRIRQRARLRLRAQLVERQGPWRTALQVLAWPAVSTLKAAGAARRQPAGAGRRLRHLATGCWLQWAHNLRISDQDQHALLVGDRWRQAADYITCREHQAVLTDYTHAHPDAIQRIFDKRDFARFCGEHRLPHPTILSESGDGGAVHHAPWPVVDLIFKPAHWAKGSHIQRLRPDADGSAWIADDGGRVTPATVAAFAEARLGPASWLIQPRLVNHASWRDLACGALATVRLVTAVRPGDTEPVPVCALLRLPRRGSVVDNMSAGGLGALVDLATGRATAGFNLNEGHVAFTHHPDSGAPVAGAIVPGFADLVALAVAAHRPARTWLSVGWDVALTEDGPTLIEANDHWAMPARLPAAETPYVEIMESALQRLAAAH